MSETSQNESPVSGVAAKGRRRGREGVLSTPSGRWKAIWRDPEGRQRSKTFVRREDAVRFRRKMLLERDRGDYRDPSLGRTTLDEFWPRFLAASPHLRPATVDLYTRLSRLHILPELGRRPLGTLSRLDIEAWVAQLAERRGPATTDAAYRILRRVLGAAEAAGILPRNPARGVKTPKAPRKEMRYLSAAEVWRIVDATPPPYQTLVLLLALCGLRIGEALALTTKDVDLLRRTIRVTKAASEVSGRVLMGATKTGASRAIALPRVVADAISSHLEQWPSGPEGLVFTAPEGGIIRRTNFRRRVWFPALRAARITSPLPRIHDLRHTAAALAIQTGAHPKAIQEMLGHSSITVTLDRYGHLFPSLAEALAERMDSLFLRPTALDERLGTAES
jgi:integrase